MLDFLSRTALYAWERRAELLAATGDHLQLVGLALLAATLVGLPLGVLAARLPRLGWVLLNAANGLRVLPSLAILFLAIPYLGLSRASAVLALAVLALPPIVLNTEAAFRGLAPFMREVAQGLGMTSWQQFWRVEWPLAWPVVLAGFKTATIEVLSSATLAAFIGGGGLGIYLTRGFAMYDPAILLVGALPVAALTLLAEVLLSRFTRS